MLARPLPAPPVPEAKGAAPAPLVEKPAPPPPPRPKDRPAAPAAPVAEPPLRLWLRERRQKRIDKARRRGRIDPDTGQPEVTVRQRLHRRRRERRQKAPSIRRQPLFGRRIAVVYDLAGPRVRLGIAWFAAVMVALRLGTLVTAVVFAVTAGLAGYQTMRAWRYHRLGGHQWVAAAGAGLVPLAAAVGTGFMALAMLGVVVAAVVVSLGSPDGKKGVLKASSLTVRTALVPGVAAAGMVLAIRLDIAAAVVLALFVAAYETGDFLIGSGAGNSWEGPGAGMAAMAAVAFCVAVLNSPPFNGSDTWLFFALAAVACPLGQLGGSLLLPSADAPAPALRRLDSLLLLGPLWAWLVGAYLAGG